MGAIIVKTIGVAMRLRLLSSILVVVGVLSACGGGGGGGGGTITTPSTSLGGVAATGASISGGTVDAVCASGTVQSTTTDASGNYSLDTTHAQLPCVIKVSVPGTSKNLYSLAESGATTANVTPLTHLLSDLLFGADSATVFANFGSTYAQTITTTNIAAAKTKVVSTLAALGIDVSTLDPLKDSFTPTTATGSGDATDQKLDQLATALVAANKSLTDISTALNANNTQTISSIISTTVGSSAKSLNGCPYVRGGNYWTFNYNGASFNEWTIDLTAMTATLYGTSNTYPVAQLTANGANVPCAFTITMTDSVVTAYFSKSAVFSWKQQMNVGGGWYFGLGVPVQTQTDLKSADYVGTYPMLGYLAYQSGGSNYQSALPMEIAIDSSGNVKSASCSLTNGAPVCAALSSSSNTSALTCGTISTGYISCASADNSVSAKVFGLVSQQQPTVFMLMSGTVNGSAYTALVVGTKSNTLKLPAVGATLSTSTAWYFSRNAQANPNTSWTFSSGDSATGASTTVSSVSTANGSYTMSNGLVWYLNLPIDGEVWTPTVTNSNFTSGSSQMLSLSTNGGWSMRVTGLPTATTFNNFNGLDFFITKPVSN